MDGDFDDEDGDFDDEDFDDEDDVHICDDERVCEAIGCAGDGTFFAVPGGNSALRAASATNPRNLPCPNCGTPDVLTPADRARGYQCDRCADRAESGLD